jgi:hypothetical protein
MTKENNITSSKIRLSLQTPSNLPVSPLFSFCEDISKVNHCGSPYFFNDSPGLIAI